MSDTKTADPSQFTKQSGRFALWIGPVIAPLAWLTDLQLSFAADRTACTSQSSMLLHLATIISLAVALLGVWLTWRTWKKAGEQWPGEEEGVVPRSCFLAFVGFGVNVLFVAAILAQSVPKLMLNPCQ